IPRSLVARAADRVAEAIDLVREKYEAAMKSNREELLGAMNKLCTQINDSALGAQAKSRQMAFAISARDRFEKEGTLPTLPQLAGAGERYVKKGAKIKKKGIADLPPAIASYRKTKDDKKAATLQYERPRLTSPLVGTWERQVPSLQRTKEAIVIDLD